MARRTKKGAKAQEPQAALPLPVPAGQSAPSEPAEPLTLATPVVAEGPQVASAIEVAATATTAAQPQIEPPGATRASSSRPAAKTAEPAPHRRWVVLGTGALGRAVARRILDDGHPVRMVNRSGRMDDHPAGVELHGARLEDPTRAARLLEGAEVAFVCVAPEPHRFVEDGPPLLRSILAAAELHGVRLVVAGSVHLYGDTQGRPMTEESKVAPTSRSEATRAELDRLLWEVHARGRARIAVVRAADFYGPWVRASRLGERVFARLIAGDPMRVDGDPQLPHSYTYIGDMAHAMVHLATDERGWGRAWHAPTAKATSTRDLLERAARLVGRAARLAIAGRTATRVAGFFSPAMREEYETRHRVEKPFVVESDTFTRTFGLAPTPLENGLAETISWFRSAKES
jgi:nucleoside-diphosphate-sugar epimerase